jgi:membrane protease YdiL (CAAX protease family)
MNLGKLTLSTLAFVLLTELIAVWVFLDLWFNIESFIDKYYLLVNGLIQIALVAAFIVFVDGLDGIKPNRTSKNYYLTAIFSGLAFVFAQYPLYQLYNFLFGTDFNIVLDFDFARLKTLNMFAIIFFLPIAEEIFFKQYIQRRLQLTFNKFNSILLSAILFSIVHLNMGAIFLEHTGFSFDTAYIALFGGIISGILYSKSNSIGPSIVFHMMWNFVAIAA